MPYLKIQCNVALDDSAEQKLLESASAAVAASLSKPERYVMVALEPQRVMMFAGSCEPLAFLEVKSIALPESQTSALSAVLCDLVTELLAIPQERVFIEFTDVPRNLWGWNRGTF